MKNPWKKQKREKRTTNNEQTAAIQLRKKTVTLIASFAMLLMLGIFAAVAWYTRIIGITGMTFDAANFDFNADYVSSEFMVDVSDYLGGGGETAVAPGASGVIPILMQASNSDVAVEYTLNIDQSGTAPEFVDRIKFFYYTLDGGQYVRHDLYMDSPNQISGTIDAGEEVYEYIYWEWKYSADITAVLQYPTSGSGGWKSFETIEEMTDTQLLQAVNNWQIYRYYDAVNSKYDELKAAGHFALLDPRDTTGEKWPTEEDRQSGARIREWIQEQVLDQYDLLDTALALGEYDEEFVSANGTTYRKQTDSSGGGREVLGYQAAMRVGLNVTGAQPIPKPRDEVENGGWPTNGGSVVHPTSKVSGSQP